MQPAVQHILICPWTQQIHIPLDCYCSLHTGPTLLDISVKNKTNSNIYLKFNICTSYKWGPSNAIHLPNSNQSGYIYSGGITICIPLINMLPSMMQREMLYTDDSNEPKLHKLHLAKSAKWAHFTNYLRFFLTTQYV